MLIKQLVLQNFRSYEQKHIILNDGVTVIIGPNTAGKSNLIESIFLLSTGKSFRADKDLQMIKFESAHARVTGQVEEADDKHKLEVLIVDNIKNETRGHSKKFSLNGLPKRRVDFAGILPSLLFVPSDLDIITSSPSHRRTFLDDVLETVDRNYMMSLVTYSKALRQRNALLDMARQTGIRNEQQFSYWDDLLIVNGNYISEKRRELIDYFNSTKKELLGFNTTYDDSEISAQRLLDYRQAESGSKVTLVGPHRDDFYVEFKKNQDVRYFGSRGQQRLVVLQLKLLQLSFIEKKLNKRPLLLLDDIFSELDDKHIKDVLSIVNRQQTILTTTHEEFIRELNTKGVEKISLV